ncbi:hypothetical protein ACFQHO_48285 [Actinomadura yumaensis]|uniref:hypothetical protein n=1 Tax=Actinomadura yumaensis TaxID=111807 RepID=UPI00361F64FA
MQLTIGQAAYRVGEDATWKKPAELSRHLTLNRKYPAVRGDVFFSAADLAANRHGFAARVRDDHYPRPAVPPVVQDRGGEAPRPPRTCAPNPRARASRSSGGPPRAPPPTPSTAWTASAPAAPPSIRSA